MRTTGPRASIGRLASRPTKLSPIATTSLAAESQKPFPVTTPSTSSIWAAAWSASFATPTPMGKSRPGTSTALTFVTKWTPRTASPVTTPTEWPTSSLRRTERQNLISEYAYTPYGRALGSTNAQGQIPNPYLFVGSEGAMEELPGLYFMRARYYWADPGVFLSADPVRHVGPGWLPTAYSYAGNNPFNYVDPRGLSESDLQLWGAFGIGGYADIEWSSSVLPTIQVGIGGGLGAGASYTYSTGEPDTTGGNRSIIAVAAAGPISGQGTLTWKQGQSVFSGSQSAAAQVGEGPVSFGGTISGNGVSLQQSYGLGIGGAGFYTQPLSAWQTGFERASAAAWNLMFPGWEPALAQGSTKTKLPYDETIAPPLQPVSVSRQANSCATGVSTHGAVLNNLQSSTPALPSIQSGATASPFTSASVITGGPAFNFAVNLLASQNRKLHHHPGQQRTQQFADWHCAAGRQ